METTKPCATEAGMKVTVDLGREQQTVVTKQESGSQRGYVLFHVGRIVPRVIS